MGGGDYFEGLRERTFRFFQFSDKVCIGRIQFLFVKTSID